MRLIDADALFKVLGFTEDCKKCEHRYNDMLCDSAIWRDVCDAIFEAPTIDAVPVVRCKDCKWWTKQEASIQGRCALAGIYPTGGWYCGNGKREDNE